MKTNRKMASGKWLVASGLKILIILLIGGIGVQTNAYEFSIYGGGGLHTLMYDVNYEKYDVKRGEGPGALGFDKDHGFGGLVGFGYTHFFTPNWGLGSGLEIALYKASYDFRAYFQKPYKLKDSDGRDLEFRSSIIGYKEEQNAMMLQIPLMLQYTSNETNNKAIYYALGAKIGIPLAATNEISASKVINSGYREFEDYLYETQTFLGFGTFNGENSKEDLSLKTAIMLSTETGMKWKLSDALRLYTGVYFDYGLNSISKGKAPDRAVEYTKTGDTGDFAFNSMVEEMAPLAIGLKVKLAFDAGAAANSEANRIRAVAEEAARIEAERRAIAEEAVRLAAAEEETARLAAAEEARRRAAEREAARLAAIGTGMADSLQAKIDAIQNQVLNDFRITQTQPDARQIPALDQIIELLKEHPELRFYLNGHTCDKGDKEVNRRVGYERAKAVRDYVVAKGIDETRVLGIGSKLFYEPLVPNTSEENRRKNRRVEFVIEKWMPVEDEIGSSP